MIALSELPGSKQMIFGSFDPFTGCSERCWPTQPASANISLRVASRCRLLPVYLFNRPSTTSRETGLYLMFWAAEPIQDCSSNVIAALTQNIDDGVRFAIL
jgi:hypothetical protein